MASDGIDLTIGWAFWKVSSNGRGVDLSTQISDVSSPELIYRIDLTHHCIHTRHCPSRALFTNVLTRKPFGYDPAMPSHAHALHFKPTFVGDLQ